MGVGRVWLGMCFIDNMGYLYPDHVERIGKKPAVTSPGEEFCAHKARPASICFLEQFGEMTLEFIGPHVIGVRTE